MTGGHGVFVKRRRGGADFRDLTPFLPQQEVGKGSPEMLCEDVSGRDA